MFEPDLPRDGEVLVPTGPHDAPRACVAGCLSAYFAVEMLPPARTTTVLLWYAYLYTVRNTKPAQSRLRLQDSDDMLQGGDETSIPDEGGEPLSPSRGEPPLSTAAPAATPPKRSLPVPGTYVTPLITVTTTTPTPSRSSGIIIECGRCGERHSRAAGACPLPPGYASPVIQARRPGVCAVCAEPFVILPGVAEKIVAVSDFPWSHLPCVLLMLKPLADLHSIEDRLAFLASTLPETVAQVPTPRRLSYVALTFTSPKVTTP